MFKLVERAWRAMWIRVLLRVMRRPAGAAPDWGARRHRVLFLRHGGRAGDMILSTGVMRRIAESSPTIELDVLASPLNAEILDGASYIRRVIVFDKRRSASYAATMGALRRARYDAVIDCMLTASSSLTTLVLMAATGAPYRVGIAGYWNDSAVNVSIAGVPRELHMVDGLGLLGAAFGIDPRTTDWSPTIALREEEGATADRHWTAGANGNGPRVLVNISAGAANRMWPIDRYAAVIRHIRMRRPDAVVRVIGAPADRARVDAVATAGAAGAVTTPNFRSALAMVATANLVITPDTSIAHAASAFKRPCVGLYLTRCVREWGPYKTTFRVVAHPAETLESLAVEPVSKAVDELLDEL